MEDRIYKYRLDFYYQSLVIYLIFFAVYLVVRGSVEKKFSLIFDDPIVYILIIFISIFLVMVLVNIIRQPIIVLKEDKMILKNRFGSREILFSDIINLSIGKKRRSQDEGAYKIIKMKLKNRRRQFRIRAYDFENGKELIKDFLKIKQVKTA